MSSTGHSKASPLFSKKLLALPNFKTLCCFGLFVKIKWYQIIITFIIILLSFPFNNRYSTCLYGNIISLLSNVWKFYYYNFILLPILVCKDCSSISKIYWFLEVKGLILFLNNWERAICQPIFVLCCDKQVSSRLNKLVCSTFRAPR